MPTYDVYVKFRLLELVPTKGSQRREIVEFILGLGEQPFTPGDYVEVDASSRECQVKLVGGHAVVYWPDHAVKMVMVISIQPADREHYLR